MKHKQPKVWEDAYAFVRLSFRTDKYDGPAYTLERLGDRCTLWGSYSHHDAALSDALRQGYEPVANVDGDLVLKLNRDKAWELYADELFTKESMSEWRARLARCPEKHF